MLFKSQYWPFYDIRYRYDVTQESYCDVITSRQKSGKRVKDAVAQGNFFAATCNPTVLRDMLRTKLHV